MKKLLVLCLPIVGCTAFAGDSPKFHAGDEVRVTGGFYAGCHGGVVTKRFDAVSNSYQVEGLCCKNICLVRPVQIDEADLASE